MRVYLDVLVKQYEILMPESFDPLRTYSGTVTQDDGVVQLVEVKSKEGSYLLPNARAPYRRERGRFGWGYGGDGSTSLSISILCDATDGDLAIAEKHWEAFLKQVVVPLPQFTDFSLPRSSVIEWLGKQGVSAISIERRARKLRLLWDQLKPRFNELVASLNKDLVNQRFDIVPRDFEGALYLDLMEMLKTGRRVFRCAECNYPISYFDSDRGNRQRARWEKGLPIYHEHCNTEQRKRKKRTVRSAWGKAARRKKNELSG